MKNGVAVMGGSNRAGFTIIEIILIVAILGLLSLTALDRFYDFSSEAEQTAEVSMVGSIRTGINLIAVDAMSDGGPAEYPSFLDAASNSAASPSNPLFTEILQSGITSQWNKLSTTSYLYVPTNTTYTYDSTSGSFE